MNLPRTLLRELPSSLRALTLNRRMFDASNPQPLPQDQLSELSRLAEAAAHRAYAPYSRFYVGAAILLESGEVVTGCNVENASYRLTTCAEQTAIAAAVAQYGPAIRIRALVLANLNPCGACRQTIAEFAPPTAIVVSPNATGDPSTCTLAELLPASFKLDVR